VCFLIFWIFTLILIIILKVLTFKARNECYKHNLKPDESIWSVISFSGLMRCLENGLSEKDNKKLKKYDLLITYLFAFLILMEFIFWFFINPYC